jgi:DNA-binding NarL/FixJ family response regulator
VTAAASSSPAIRIVIADDHPVVREGMRALLLTQSDFDVVGDASDGDAAVRLAGELRPDVILMDLRMPGTDGATATAEISARYPGVHVLVVTTYDSDQDIHKAVEAGAAGYLLKDTPRDDLCGAVRAAARGETVLAPAVAARLVTHMRAPKQSTLTPRETEVLACVARGLTNADVGRELFIGEATVKTHLLRAFAKLGVDDRTAAVTVALERGLQPDPSNQA